MDAHMPGRLVLVGGMLVAIAISDHLNHACDITCISFGIPKVGSKSCTILEKSWANPPEVRAVVGNCAFGRHPRQLESRHTVTRGDPESRGEHGARSCCCGTLIYMATYGCWLPFARSMTAVRRL